MPPRWNRAPALVLPSLAIGGLFSLGDKQMRNTWADRIESDANAADGSPFYPTLFCQEKLAACHIHEAKYWKRVDGREILRPASELPNEARFLQEYLWADVDIVECLRKPIEEWL